MTSAPALLLPQAPLLAVGLRRAVLVTVDGEIEDGTLPQIARLLSPDAPPYLCHAPALSKRLEIPGLWGYDLLELFALVRPATFCVPTPRGLAQALDLPIPKDLTDAAMILRDAAALLLAELADARDAETLAIIQPMAAGGWPWGRFAEQALAGVTAGRRGLAVWRAIPEIPDHPADGPPGQQPVHAQEARWQLASLLGDHAESRPSQADYASATALAFQPRQQEDQPHIVLAEAGTGVGKTLGYLAPASVWARKNGGTVWVSTYTRNLQHQIDQELDRLYPDPVDKALKAVVRKGRENYLCLLNLEENTQIANTRPSEAVGVGLMARWVLATRDGDLSGGDFPGWLPELLGRARTLGLADRRGECIFAACHHFNRCFVERSIRRAKRAEIVIANHALVMVQSALGGGDDGAVPSRLVFDEGHHLFDAADSAFSAHLSGLEGQEMRRWLLGAEGSSRSRARGLRRRIEELLSDEGMLNTLGLLIRAAHALPGDGWQNRLIDDAPNGSIEAFLSALRRQVLARQTEQDRGYSLEADAAPANDDLLPLADDARSALIALREPGLTLKKRLSDRLVDEAEDMETEVRLRIEAAVRALDRRLILPLAGWIAMLEALREEPSEEFVDWFGIDRQDGQETDIGMHRHWRDPSKPFARTVAEGAHGIIVTSATLTDSTGDPEADWRAAERRIGLPWITATATRAQLPSPYDYAAQTRVLVVTDVRRDDIEQVASAYRALFLAAGGGALGLFTAISRLRAVHSRIAGPLEDADIPLLAQHVDGMETASLIDIFRAEENACLLGTDAVRDGVDVPGRSLRLIVFDRIPWPRPDILHKARREAFGGWNWDRRLVRLKLKQAFGRLVRRADDTGVFVLLEPMPSDFRSAFPPGVEVKRVGLAEAVREVGGFLGRG
ncbi:ATP-dependent DNA helicase [Elstera sp.]|uniref:ATP-dependent DNA helicase n=1 Tax=Elstera sp. TaxID=1916664 RepID=UPI0037C13B79